MEIIFGHWGPWRALDTENSNQEVELKKPRTRRRFKGFWTFFSAFLGAVLVGLVILSVSGRVLNAPNWVVRQVEDQINLGMPEGRIHVGEIEFKIGKSGRPEASLRNLGVFDGRGSEIMRLNAASARFSPMNLLQGKLRPESLRLRGAEVTLRRRADGQFALSFGSGAGTTNSIPGLLDGMDQAMEIPAVENVQNIAADGLTITLEDARTGRFWRATDGQINVRRTGTGLDISAAFDVFNGTEDLAEIVVGIGTRRNSSMATIGTSIKNAIAGDIAVQTPALSFLSVIDAPISGSLRAGFGVSGDLETFAGTLGIGAGVLDPGSDSESVPFNSARAYFTFDPIEQKLNFSEVSLESNAVTVAATGHAYLRDFVDFRPETLLGQLAFSEINAHPASLYAEPVVLSGGSVDFRLHLNPFLVEVGQLVLSDAGGRLQASGKISPRIDGWAFAGEILVDAITRNRLMELWPKTIIPNTREWVVQHLPEATFRNLRIAARGGTDGQPRRMISWSFEGATIHYLKAHPPVEAAAGYATINENTLTLVLESGQIRAPLGDAIDIAESVVQIPDISIIPAQANIDIKGVSEIRSILSLMDGPPFNVLRNASFGPDVATGRIRFDAHVDFPLVREIELSDVNYGVDARMVDVTSDQLVPERSITGKSLRFKADNDGLEITGPVMLGNVAADVLWRKENGAEHIGKSSVTGSVELSQDFVDEFAIGLPQGTVDGTATGQFEVNFEREQSPRFTLSSDLNRIGLRISPVGWAKPKNATGRLWVAGSLGEQLSISSLELASSGLDARGGRVVFNEDGTMQTTRFERVRLDGWLDAPVTFTARRNASPAISLSGGTLDVRKTTFGGGSGASGSAGSSRGPLTLRLDRVIISEGISLNSFRGDLDSSGGISGAFSARLNGRTPINGTLLPSKNGTAIQVTSRDGGSVLRDAGIVEYAKGGNMTVSLVPRGPSGVYDGTLRIQNTRVKNAPGMTDLLSAVSIVGLIEQLDGQGIAFETMEADFQLSPQSVLLNSSSAVGASLGVTLDGVYDLTTSQMNMQGVVSPVYFLNAIGEVLTRKGEGLFGFSFTLTGSSASPKVNVNPLSILTPGMLRDIFRKQPAENQ